VRVSVKDRGSCPQTQRSRPGGAKQPHQQCLVTNKRKNDRSFINESKVVYRNTLLPFLLSICLGVSYRTAYSFFYFQATCATSKNRGAPRLLLLPTDIENHSCATDYDTIRYDTIHTHPFNGPFPGLPRSAGVRNVKPIWILLKQETVSGSGINWAICKSAPRSRQIG